MPKQDGAVIRSSDGSVYFIRQEILEAARVSEDELADTEKMLEESEGDVSGFNFSTGPILSVTPVSFNNPTLASPNLAGADLGSKMSTIMCCW